MADTNDSTVNDRRPEHLDRSKLAFGAPAGGLYQIADDVGRGDLQDQLNARTSQLIAMLHLTCGEPGEAFRCASADLQDNYMWGCAMLADEIKQLQERVLEAAGATKGEIRAAVPADGASLTPDRCQGPLQ